MIYLTGDLHGSTKRLSVKIFPEQREMTKDDYVIICGDFGVIWEQDHESDSERYLLDELDHRSFTTLFVDGNHENFNRIFAYPIEEWHGGMVHKIRPSVLHLMRGQVYEIEGATIFSFGGASSHDIEGGILESDDPDFKRKKKQLDRDNIRYRINRITWWERELPTEEEMEEGRRNLAAHNNVVDYIVTHCCATSTQDIIGEGRYAPDVLTDYLEEIKKTVDYKKWFFGHYHDNKNISETELLLYEQIIRIR